ncbi:MAG TPA: PA0069 family radical SAM protein [Planctomycetota bacterium]|nr:PA0069 family radical SAM protein [Planctomycetota bacterium]
MPRLVSNPPNPWSSQHVELLGPAPPAELVVYEERARSIVSENDSPDLGFRFSLNPYRGCLHACAYCYARPTHQYLGFGAGTDFDRRIVVKTNAPELLRRRFLSRSWTGELLVFSGVTDCYQPLEASYELTRRCLAVCLEFGNPVGIITKGALVRRDADLLGELSARAGAKVHVSIPFADDALARAIEPFASSPSARFDTLRRLAAAGVRVGVMVAPIIPGLNDSQVPEILERAAAAGATSAGHVLLRLPAEVLPVFEERLREAVPLRAGKVLSALAELHGGRLNDPRFGSRMRGSGPRWQAIESLFELHCRRLGLNERRVGREGDEAPRPTFRRPDPQGTLF